MGVQRIGDQRILTFTIGASASASNAVDIGTATNVAIEVPVWGITAKVTFVASRTVDGTFSSLRDSTGAEYSLVPNTAVATIVHLKDYPLAALRFVKLISGLSTALATQTSSKTLYAITK